MAMEAVTFRSKGVVRVVTMPRPRIRESTDAIVRVTHAGICGSDLHPLFCREEGLDAGTVMGHEFVGEVVEIGAAVRVATVGKRVFTPFTTSCGECFYCRRGLSCRCVHSQLFGWISGGQGLHGGQAEYVRVPLADSTLRELPADVLPEEALLVGDILSTGFHCAMNAGVGDQQFQCGAGMVVVPRDAATSTTVARVDTAGAGSGAGAGVGAGGDDSGAPDGQVFAIVGCGPVGLMTVLSCAAMGVPASRLYAVDCVPDRLRKAAEFGATPINFNTQNAEDVIQKVTGGRGADGVMEAVGAGSALATAYKLVRPGGVISSIGVHTDPTLPFNGAQLYDKNVTLRAGRCPARDVMEKVLPMVQSRRFEAELASLITHRLPLTDAVKAYDLFANKLEGCVKCVLCPDATQRSKL